MRRPSNVNSNLFAIDHDAIRATLADANEQLLQRCHDLLAAFARVPDPLVSDDEIIRARHFVEQIQKATREVRDARLSDGRPFRDAATTVKAFFEEIEKPLQSKLQIMLSRLTDAAHRNQAKAVDPPEVEPNPVGIDTSGNTVVTARTPDPPQTTNPSAEIKLAWSIKAFDRSTLGLEALRPYLTDAAILVACRKHLSDHGPHKLAGVLYCEIAQPD